MAAILDLSLKETPDHKIVARSGFLALKSVTTHVFCNVARYFDENIILLTVAAAIFVLGTF